MSLELNGNGIGAVINKDTASRVHVFILGLALGGEEISLGGTYKLIKRETS
jgi:hypothetical protein